MNTESTSEQAAVATSTIASNALAASIVSLVRPGERYAGVMLNADGSLSHHLFLLPGDVAGLSWDKAVAWAREAGGELPTRAEQAVLFGNAKGQFKKDWYWSDEQHAANAVCAWCQDFGYGIQSYYGGKSASLRARAVRRLIIS